MILPTDIPSRADVDRLFEHRAPASVSIYLPTDPASKGEAERIEFKTLAAQAYVQLREAGAGVRTIRQIEEEIEELYEDEEFWRYQARSLAAFATPQALITFRLPNRLLGDVHVSDRFHLRPLLRTLTFAHVAFVLALAQGSVRVVEVTPDLDPVTLELEDLPSDVASAASARTVLDELYAAQLRDLTELYAQRSADGRTLADVAEIARRAWLNGAHVLAVRGSDIPGESAVAAILRYPM